MTPLQYLVPPGSLDDAAPSHLFHLTGQEARHAVRVARLLPGERVDVVDGVGARLAGVVEAARTPESAGPRGRGEIGLRRGRETAATADGGATGPGQVVATAYGGAEPVLTLRVLEVTREANDAAGIVLVQALAKAGRDELAVAAATGLGVERIWPWAATRCVVRWEGSKAQRGRARWEAIARQEVKVARRAWCPRVDPLATTADLVAMLHTGPLAGMEMLVLHEEAGVRFTAAVRDLPGPVALVVGPEGGIAPAELQELSDAGARPVRLGQAVLRASLAGPAALAALAALRGGWD